MQPEINQLRSGYDYDPEEINALHQTTDLPLLDTNADTDLTLHVAAMVFPHDSRWLFDSRTYTEEKEKTAMISKRVHESALKGDGYAHKILEAYDLYIEYLETTNKKIDS